MPTPIQDGLSLREAIRGAADATIGNTLGSFVAADPNDIPEALRPAQAGYRRTCDIYAATGAVGSGLLGPALGALCDPYLGADAPVFSPGQPQFSGGQCADISYLVNFSVVPYPPSPVAGQLVSGFVETVPGPFGGISSGTSPNNPALTGWFITHRDITNGFIGDYEDLVINSVTRADGQPDTCGDGNPQPDTYTPVRPGPPPGPDFRYTPTTGPNITINVGSPSVRLDGTVNIPITIGGRQYDGNAGEPTGASGEPSDGPDLENPGTPEAPPPGEDENDSDTPLVCAIVRTTVIDEGRGALILGDTERLYNPPLAYFRFKFQNGSTSAWVAITHPDQLVCYSCCDVEADGYYVKWSFRCNGSVTPIRLKSQRED